MLNEFKAFIARGNVLDLAVGIILGAAFTAIVTSLVDDLINPLIGLVIGGIDFSAWGFKVGEASFNIGNFINAIIKFLIVAWVVFLIVKAVNRMTAAALAPKPAAPEAPKGPTAEELLAEIRDALKARG
jgi:large conductance mechanosensitive channel